MRAVPGLLPDPAALPAAPTASPGPAVEDAAVAAASAPHTTAGAVIGAELHTPSRRLLGNVISLGSGEIAARAVAFVGTAYVSRQLGPAGFGTIGFATALCGYLSIAVSAGFGDVGAREIARRPREVSVIAASVMLVRVLMACLAFGVLALIVPWLHESATVKAVVLLTGLSFFSLALDTGWVFKGLERNALVGMAIVAAQLVYVAVVLAAVSGPASVRIVPVARFVGELGAAGLLAIPLLKLGHFAVHLREGLRILKASGFLTFSRLLRTLIFTFDVVMIGVVLNKNAVGYYTAAYNLCFLLVAVATSVSVAFLPMLSRAAAHGAGELKAAADRSMELAAAIGAPLVAGTVVLAEPILHFINGPGYEPGAAALAVLALSIGCIFLSNTVHNVLLACDRLHAEMWTIAAAAALNVGLNLLVIRHYGILGAAWATLSAEGLVLLLGVWLMRGCGVTMNWLLALRPIAAAAVMAAGVWLIALRIPLPVSIAAGAAIYAVVLILLGVPHDLKPVLGKLKQSLASREAP
jgi:O-antigen/teichoic acid export membrane protein